MKIGTYSVPDLRLFPTIYNDVKLVYENYKLEEVKDEDTVAKLLKHKRAGGGTWNSKVADIRLYGLLEPRGFKLTPLAERLCFGTEDQIQEATKETILNIPLWKQLYSNFGIELPESNFWVQLQKFTGVDPLEARNQADFARKAYLDDVSHIKATNKPRNRGDHSMGNNIDISMSTINIQAGPFSQNIPWTKKGVELAKGFLDLLGAQIKEPKEESKEEPKEEA